MLSSFLHCSISVQEQAINVADEYTALADCDTDCANGALCFFAGTVRGGAVQAMTLEHYPGMTEQALATIAENACQRWQLAGVRIVHRVGRLLPGEVIVFVGVQSAHRVAAFAACHYIADFLKTQAPFWKKEETSQGSRWVSARDEDETARQRWQE